jgi:nucleotide-binding universal stress UspA family protein
MSDKSRSGRSESSSIRDLVVQLTGSSEDQHRLAMATAIAEAFDAHVIGVHLHVLPDILDITDPVQSATIRTMLEASDQEADKAFEKLKATMSATKMPSELVRLHGLAADVGTDLAAIARTADLFIGTRPYGDPENRYRIEEQVLFGAGRACLFLPPGGTPHREFRTIAVAWDKSREAARAVAEAMPFLERAQAVHLVHIASSWDDDKTMDKELTLVVAHLQRHGVQAKVVKATRQNSTGEQIEEAAHQLDADLIVMGAYAHTRLIEIVFGGATRYILRRATLPVLMAH